jgi:hypothetical protein
LLRLAVAKVALPVGLMATGAPTSAPSIWNCTEPIGWRTEKSRSVTEAVKVTCCPTVDGFFDDATAVAVRFAFTICVIVWLLVTKLPFVPL